MTDLKIGALAERTGTTAPTIRYYESIGLLPCPDQTCAGGPGPDCAILEDLAQPAPYVPPASCAPRDRA